MKKCVNGVAFILVVVGALNWGLWGFFQFDLVAWLFGGNTTGMSRLVYSLVGLAGIWNLRFLSHFCGCCCKDKSCKK
ncbi:MAG: putative rane protein yuzA [Chlamydiota bacterium]|jgi:uncharacterized membrane protein YuzA (DUF378 family)